MDIPLSAKAHIKPEFQLQPYLQLSMMNHSAGGSGCPSTPSPPPPPPPPPGVTDNMLKMEKTLQFYNFMEAAAILAPLIKEWISSKIPHIDISKICNIMPHPIYLPPNLRLLRIFALFQSASTDGLQHMLQVDEDGILCSPSIDYMLDHIPMVEAGKQNKKVISKAGDVVAALDVIPIEIPHSLDVGAILHYIRQKHPDSWRKFTTAFKKLILYIADTFIAENQSPLPTGGDGVADAPSLFKLPLLLIGNVAASGCLDWTTLFESSYTSPHPVAFLKINCTASFDKISAAQPLFDRLTEAMTGDNVGTFNGNHAKIHIEANSYQINRALKLRAGKYN
jgi:hypothetical protein